MPIRVNQKFRENSPKSDVARSDVNMIVDMVLNQSKPMQGNNRALRNFVENKKPRDYPLGAIPEHLPVGVSNKLLTYMVL